MNSQPGRRPSSPRRRSIAAGICVLLVLVVVELLGQIGFRFFSGQRDWPWLIGTAHRRLFMPHPFLVGVPRPGASVTRYGIRISHNSLGWRGPEVAREKPAGVTRIVALGGSSTYCSGIDDGATWPLALGRELGGGFQVLNLGVPGYSSTEHVIQTALEFSDLKPDIAIYYDGWNDVRDFHVQEVAGDYASYHGRQQAGNLGLVGAGPRLAIARLPWVVWIRIAYPPAFHPDAQAYTSAPDQRVLGIYARHFHAIAALCRAQGVRPLLVPQRLNDAKLIGDQAASWCPCIREKDLPGAIGAGNEVLRQVAQEEGIGWAAGVAAAAFEQSDFIDDGHFSPAGAQKFARVLADDVRAFTASPAR